MNPFAFASSLLDLTPSSGPPEQRCLRPYQERVARDFLTFADEAWVHSGERFGRIVLPPRTGKLMGHAAPGRCCAELQLEAMAIERSPVNPARAAFAVARALARVCEESKNASGARPG